MDYVENMNDCIHDSTIINYKVDFKEKNLIINIKNTNEQINKIIFYNYLAHNFSNVIIDNIIFDIQETTIENFINDNKDFLEDSLRYGFPISISHNKGINELKDRLKEKQYKVFEISSSLGLNGFIIAKSMQVII